MPIIFLRIVALLVLIGVVWLGWRKWARSHRAPKDLQAQSMVALAVLAIAGGLIGSPFWWMNYPDAFAWTLPPLAARLLAAAGLSFAATGAYALTRSHGGLVRPYISLLAVYLAPLVLAIIVFHLDRFNWRAPITYAFFVIAGGMALASLWHLARGTELTTGRQASAAQAPSVIRYYLQAIAIITGLWGLAMFVWPSGPIPQIWLWPQDQLTSRLIAVMLLTLCAAGVLGTRSADHARMSLTLFATYGFSVTAAIMLNLATARPVPTAYAIMFGVLAVSSAPLLSRSTR